MSSWRPPNAFAILVLVLLAVNYFSPLADLDYTWQIRTGERIVATGNLQPPEAFSYTIAGEPLPDFEWLYEVVLWAIWEHFGYGGLKLLKTILVGLPLLILALHLRRSGVRSHGVAVAVFSAVFLLTPAWNLRPLYCTTIGLLLVTSWLHDHCAGRRPVSWWLPVVMLLWSNMHPGVITGQGLLAGAIVWEWLNRRWQWQAPLSRSRGAAWRSWAALGCSPRSLLLIRSTACSIRSSPSWPTRSCASSARCSRCTDFSARLR
jgi:hypothetical protein